MSFAATISTGGSSRLSRGDNLAVSLVSVLGMMMRSSSQSIMVNCHRSQKDLSTDTTKEESFLSVVPHPIEMECLQELVLHDGLSFTAAGKCLSPTIVVVSRDGSLLKSYGHSLCYVPEILVREYCQECIASRRKKSPYRQDSGLSVC